MFVEKVNIGLFLTSRARPLVSIGSRKFPRAQTTQATANGLRARITDRDINTWSKHTFMSHLHNTWELHLRQNWTHLSDERSYHSSNPTEWCTESHPQRPSHSGIHLRDKKDPLPETWFVSWDLQLQKPAIKLVGTYLSSVNINHVKVHRDQRTKQEQYHCEPKPGVKDRDRDLRKLPNVRPKVFKNPVRLWGPYIVVQMLTIMNKTAASSCSTVRLNLRPNTFSRQMFTGTTERTEERWDSRPDPRP